MKAKNILKPAFLIVLGCFTFSAFASDEEEYIIPTTIFGTVYKNYPDVISNQPVYITSLPVPGTMVYDTLVRTRPDGKYSATFYVNYGWRHGPPVNSIEWRITSFDSCLNKFDTLYTHTWGAEVDFYTCYPGAIISGNIITENGLPVSGTTVSLSGGSSSTVITGPDGYYEFPILSPYGSYTVMPFKNNDLTVNNGITTLDLVLLQRSLLGIQWIGSRFRSLAADVNGSNTVTSLDMVLIRAMILGNSSSFPGGNLWEFATSDFAVWPYTLIHERVYTDVPHDTTNQDFIAMKLGDVNNSWYPLILKTGAAGGMQFMIDEHQAMPGDEIIIPVRVKEFSNISGYQFTLSWDAAVLSLLDVNNKSVEAHYGISRTKEGMLTTSWNSETAEALTLDDDAVAFELKFKAAGESGTQSEIRIGSEITPTEAYNGNLDLLDIIPTSGTVKVGDVSSIVNHLSSIINLQVQPNPFTNSTQIIFTLPHDASVNIAIYDLLGKQVRHMQSSFSAGEHRIEWAGDNDAGRLLGKGLFHMQMTAGGFSKGVKVAVVR